MYSCRFTRKFRADAPFEKVIVVPYGCGSVPEGFLDYEELLAEASDDFLYPVIDENDGAAMCFTSGTTGYSKGVIYSHRALVLHSFACGLGEVFGMSHFDTVLPVAPMFHANAWGLPFACTMLGGAPGSSRSVCRSGKRAWPVGQRARNHLLRRSHRLDRRSRSA